MSCEVHKICHVKDIFVMWSTYLSCEAHICHFVTRSTYLSCCHMKYIFFMWSTYLLCEVHICHVKHIFVMWSTYLSCEVHTCHVKYICHVKHIFVMWSTYLSCEVHICHVKHIFVILSCEVHICHVKHICVMLSYEVQKSVRKNKHNSDMGLWFEQIDVYYGTERSDTDKPSFYHHLQWLNALLYPALLSCGWCKVFYLPFCHSSLLPI